jgi:hypothetical protein
MNGTMNGVKLGEPVAGAEGGWKVPTNATEMRHHLTAWLAGRGIVPDKWNGTFLPKKSQKKKKGACK